MIDVVLLLEVSLLELVVILLSSVKFVLLNLLLLVVSSDVASPFFLRKLRLILVLLERFVRLRWCQLICDVSLTINYLFLSALIKSEIISETNRRQTGIKFVVPWMSRIVSWISWSISVGSILVEWVHDSHVRVHIISNVMFICLSLIFEFSRNFFPEYGHVLLNSLLNFLLDKESNSFAHVVRNFLKFCIILPIENIGLKLTICVWVNHDFLVLVQYTTTHT